LERSTTNQSQDRICSSISNEAESMDNPQKALRQANLAFLNENGFRPATWLPLLPTAGQTAEPDGLGGVLRPTREIVHRYMALFGVFAWGAAPPEMADAITEFMASNDLPSAMAKDDRPIMQLPKNDAMEQYQDTVGWRLENMWSLAWILGFIETPSAISGQLSNEISGQIVAQFLPDLETTIDQLLQESLVRSPEEVVRQNDLFYCAHNAVRSAQMGEKTVPPEFDPIGAGGAIHERRHSLKWALSPGVDWDDIELDT
jgi:Domain of unknown function (DUF4272)